MHRKRLRRSWTAGLRGAGALRRGRDGRGAAAALPRQRLERGTRAQLLFQ